MSKKHDLLFTWNLSYLVILYFGLLNLAVIHFCVWFLLVILVQKCHQICSSSTVPTLHASGPKGCTLRGDIAKWSRLVLTWHWKNIGSGRETSFKISKIRSYSIDIFPSNLQLILKKKKDRNFPKFDNSPRSSHALTNNELWFWK